ncbi:tRNA (adenosine(37)-N6)-dimethylallyltransferase MiaA [Rhodohalobacter sp. 8-1]|uniref:tRNA (adenosine(37)-N6)-dimethylallyltransferase MiaA n=1 Tax=Rhodohalobacter sp. 8-1 TaxID=3131972 RepID=UPI0030EBF472
MPHSDAASPISDVKSILKQDLNINQKIESTAPLSVIDQTNQTNTMNHRIMIAGPTASGKSSLAVMLAKWINGEIISVDSRQCYRQINVGTAKPTEKQLRDVPHHNISNLDLSEEDSAMAFHRRAMQWAEEIEGRGRTVIFCGGSTLHLQSLVRSLDDMPSSSDENIRELETTMENEGADVLFKKLKQVDPDYASGMNDRNPRRIIRALDVWMQTGKPFSHFHNDKPFEQPENMSVFATHWPRKMLHQRIEKRCDEMLENGLIEETRQLLESGYSPDLQALQTVGYRQVIQYLKGEITREQMEKDFKTATRRYAKRQITWLRRWPFLTWLSCSENSRADLLETIQQQVAADMNKG